MTENDGANLFDEEDLFASAGKAGQENSLFADSLDNLFGDDPLEGTDPKTDEQVYDDLFGGSAAGTAELQDRTPGTVSQKTIRGGGQNASQQVETDVDIVFVIDCTGSMGPLLEKVKSNVLKMYERIKQGLMEKNRILRNLRARVIAFRDYYWDWEAADQENEGPMKESAFFRLPDQNAEFASFVNALRPAGGEDDPESSLEALHLAFQSDWARIQGKGRRIVILFTDTSPHPLNDPMRYDPARNSAYPAGVPQSLLGLQDEYESLGATYHRLIIYGPENVDTWRTLGGWGSSSHHEISRDGGGVDVSMDEVIDLIKGSVS